MPLTSSNLSSAVAALVLVLGLIWLAARGVRSAGLIRGKLGTAVSRRLVLQDSLALDRTRRLHVIRCDGRELVLLTGGTADLVVRWLPEPRVMAVERSA